MFIKNGCIWQSDILNTRGVAHGFSTREGGISRESHLASMNTGFFRGDSDEVVRENIRLLCSYAGAPENAIGTPQIHSTIVRTVKKENGGEGIFRDVPFSCDGFVTADAGISLIVRVADCAPVLLCGETKEGKAVIGAVHAGWRGAAGGIAAVGVREMKALGAENIKAAIGACIHPCCYEVGEDMRGEVAKVAGEDFANRHVLEREGHFYADIAAMSREYLLGEGVCQVDICNECTACNPDLYHSHRKTGGKRGTMAAVIGIQVTGDR